MLFITSIEDVKQVDINDIISYVVGRPLLQIFPERKAEVGEVLLEAVGISVPNLVHDIDLFVRRGEVLGFSGLVGSGRTETAKAIFGELKKSGGTIYKSGKELVIRNPNDAISAGIGLLTENRKEEGLFLSKAVSWNVVSASVEKLKKHGFLNKKIERDLVNEYVQKLRIKLPGIDRAVKYLSGGNQQKVVFAKWLCAGSDVYIFDEPTRGIDVGAKTEVYKLINTLAEQGNAIIVISSELPEVLGVCDRIAVFHEGTIAVTLNREEATQEKIMYYAMGGDSNEIA